MWCYNQVTGVKSSQFPLLIRLKSSLAQHNNILLLVPYRKLWNYLKQTDINSSDGFTLANNHLINRNNKRLEMSESEV